MTDHELDLVNNVARKLEIYIQRNNTTKFALSKLMNIDRQPFYRILNRKNVPTISSLFIIANNLSCTVQELISTYIFIDIPTYTDFLLSEKSICHRIYLQTEDYKTIENKNLYGVITGEMLRVFYKIDDFLNDGKYFVQFNNDYIDLEVLSAGSNLIIAKINNEEKRLERHYISPIAKHFKDIPIIKDAFCKITCNQTEYTTKTEDKYLV